MGDLSASIQFDRHLLATPLTESGEACIWLEVYCRKHHVHVVFSGGKMKPFHLRQSVALALTRAAELLFADGFLLVVEDAYRSLQEQKKKFFHQLAIVQHEHPELSYENAQKLANTFVAGIPILAAHTAGAAADVTMMTAKGESVDMGCPYLTLSEKALTDYPGLSVKAKAHRKILLRAMEAAGFSNYPFEYWHFSLGDVCDAYLKNKKNAIYGPIELDVTSGTGRFATDSNGWYAYFA